MIHFGQGQFCSAVNISMSVITVLHSFYSQRSVKLPILDYIVNIILLINDIVSTLLTCITLFSPILICWTICPSISSKARISVQIAAPLGRVEVKPKACALIETSVFTLVDTIQISTLFSSARWTNFSEVLKRVYACCNIYGLCYFYVAILEQYNND